VLARKFTSAKSQELFRYFNFAYKMVSLILHTKGTFTLQNQSRSLPKNYPKENF
jgi:hypothetical protein